MQWVDKPKPHGAVGGVYSSARIILTLPPRPRRDAPLSQARVVLPLVLPPSGGAMGLTCDGS